MINRSYIVLLVLLTSAAAVCAAPPSSTYDTLLAEAWRAWETGDHGRIEQKFLDALKENPSSSRAEIGLSMLYSLQRRSDIALKTFERAIEKERDINPFLYAAWFTFILEDNVATNKILRKLSVRADSLGILRAMANSVLGDRAVRNNDSVDALEHYRKLNTLNDWTVIGPFDNTSGSGFANVFPPEATYDVNGLYKGKGGDPASWFRLTSKRPDMWVDFKRY